MHWWTSEFSFLETICETFCDASALFQRLHRSIKIDMAYDEVFWMHLALFGSIRIGEWQSWVWQMALPRPAQPMGKPFSLCLCTFIYLFFFMYVWSSSCLLLWWAFVLYSFSPSISPTPWRWIFFVVSCCRIFRFPGFFSLSRESFSGWVRFVIINAAHFTSFSDKRGLKKIELSWREISCRMFSWRRTWSRRHRRKKKNTHNKPRKIKGGFGVCGAPSRTSPSWRSMMDEEVGYYCVQSKRSVNFLLPWAAFFENLEGVAVRKERLLQRKRIILREVMGNEHVSKAYCQ